MNKFKIVAAYSESDLQTANRLLGETMDILESVQPLIDARLEEDPDFITNTIRNMSPEVLGSLQVILGAFEKKVLSPIRKNKIYIPCRLESNLSDW